MLKIYKLSIIVPILFVSVFLIGPSSTHAANNEPTLSQLKSQLDLLSETINELRLNQACTMDAKICPDGSAVGRTGPNCSFAPCPGNATGTRPVINRSCMQQAVNTREKAIQEAYQGFNTSIISALETRANTFAVLWVETEIKDKNKFQQVWDEWRKASKSAREKFNLARKTAWDTYRKTAVSECKAKLQRNDDVGMDKQSSSL